MRTDVLIVLPTVALLFATGAAAGGAHRASVVDPIVNVSATLRVSFRPQVSLETMSGNGGNKVLRIAAKQKKKYTCQQIMRSCMRINLGVWKVQKSPRSSEESMKAISVCLVGQGCHFVKGKWTRR